MIKLTNVLIDFLLLSLFVAFIFEQVQVMFNATLIKNSKSN